MILTFLLLRVRTAAGSGGGTSSTGTTIPVVIAMLASSFPKVYAVHYVHLLIVKQGHSSHHATPEQVASQWLLAEQPEYMKPDFLVLSDCRVTYNDEVPRQTCDSHHCEGYPFPIHPNMIESLVEAHEKYEIMWR
eukprot:6458083-Amphidinium_carterae.2